MAWRIASEVVLSFSPRFPRELTFATHPLHRNSLRIASRLVSLVHCPPNPNMIFENIVQFQGGHDHQSIEILEDTFPTVYD